MTFVLARRGSTYACLIGLTLAACSEESGSGTETSPSGIADSGATGEWSTLVAGEWSLPPGEEDYTCVRMTVPEDMYITGFRAIAPLGTHHTLATIDDDPAPDDRDGTFACNAATVGRRMIYGSGVGTDPLEFPAGVALKLEKGQRLVFNLHLFNVGTEELSGTSGVEVLRVGSAEVEHEAEIVLAGKLGGLEVVPGVSTQVGECEIPHDLTIFAVFPHMHQLGTHLRTTAFPSSGAERVLSDAPYDFNEQKYYAVEGGVRMAAGDRVTVECTYENPGAETVYFGDSSLTEMCFSGLFRYPKGETGGLICDSTSRGDGGQRVVEGPACAEDGASGNEEGVGAHCTDGGNECSDTASICLAQYLEGDWGNFCTKLCSDDAACGSGAVCSGSGAQAVCIPEECVLGDAGAR